MQTVQSLRAIEIPLKREPVQRVKLRTIKFPPAPEVRASHGRKLVDIREADLMNELRSAKAKLAALIPAHEDLSRKMSRARMGRPSSVAHESGMPVDRLAVLTEVEK